VKTFSIRIAGHRDIWHNRDLSFRPDPLTE
jgi:hypothetical protein